MREAVVAAVGLVAMGVFVGLAAKLDRPFREESTKDANRWEL